MAKGLLTNSELVDSLIVDLNNVIKGVVSGQYIQSCCLINMMTQKLLNLKKTIDDDLKSKNKTIEDLKNQLRNCGHDVIDISGEELANIMEKDGVVSE